MQKLCPIFILSLFFSCKVISIHAQHIDIDWLESINHAHVSNGFENSMKFLSNSAIYLEAGTMIGLGVCGLATHDEKIKNATLYTAASFAVNIASTYAIKYSINRKRPYETYPDRIILRSKEASSPSFVSGSTSRAFNLATSLTLSFPKWYVAVPTYVWASSVAYSRMYLGVHYPSDVLGGIIVGIGSAYLMYEVNRRWKEKKSSKKTLSSASLAYSGFVD